VEVDRADLRSHDRRYGHRRSLAKMDARLMRLASFPRMARIDRFLAQKGRRRSRAIPHIGVRHRDDVPKRETSRIVPWREGALGNKRTFRRAFAARFLLPVAGRGRRFNSCLAPFMHVQGGWARS
jgi:hypothetical protein